MVTFAVFMEKVCNSRAVSTIELKHPYRHFIHINNINYRTITCEYPGFVANTTLEE